ncbi:hypothetical protein K1T71_000576 [Dendrolimus kikuchii]|uniref:Uncharacterized protein n=1 Tax=Dendrolimus kikuchii TaxID=765133 RepID=A0ACC1DKF1_9NEOP|nr:hypothetical protein K1T71_000576 [Dendrolimus kikuchii]
MQKSDRWPEDYDSSAPKGRPGSRRNSATLSRRNSLKKEKEKKSPPSSNSSTPKKTVKNNLDFVVTGKQITKRGDRANSLPGSYHRRPSIESGPAKSKRTFESPKRVLTPSNSSKSQETSLDDDVSLDLSQVSDFEDTNSKYGIKKKFNALATSTPKPQKTQKSRSCSLQSQIHVQKLENSRREKSLESAKQSFSSMSRDSMRTCSSGYRYGDLDYSSVSPEYSGQSSADISPRVSRPSDTPVTPRSQDMQVSSCVSTYQDCSDTETKVEDFRKPETGEWNNFWANYNNSISEVPLKSYYDQCPTPYRTDSFDLADLDIPNDETRKPSPEKLRSVNHVIRQEGLRLTPRETQNMVKCAHILALAQEIIIKIYFSVPEESKKEMTTQTDISLPNTKSAPRIFENILRQLSRSSLEDKIKETKEIVARNAEKEKNKGKQEEKNTDKIKDQDENNTQKHEEKSADKPQERDVEKQEEKCVEENHEKLQEKCVEKHEENDTDKSKSNEAIKE